MANTKPLKLINIARRYKHIRPVPRMPNFAAWIEGVDLTQPLVGAGASRVAPGFVRFRSHLLRTANDHAAQHVALAKVFGPLSGGSYFERNPKRPTWK